MFPYLSTRVHNEGREREGDSAHLHVIEVSPVTKNRKLAVNHDHKVCVCMHM